MSFRKAFRRSTIVATVAVTALILGTGSPAFAFSAAPSARPAAADGHGALGVFGPLTDLVIQRLVLGDQVAASKFGTGQPIDDPVREQQELAAVRQRALAMDLDPDATVAFFGDQINASKIVQRGLFARWTTHPDQAPTSRPDLGTLRATLDALTTELLQQLQATQSVRQPSVSCAVQLIEGAVSGEIVRRLDSLHRRALDTALHSVCVA
jgi:chorismate mutase-like protein